MRIEIEIPKEFEVDYKEDKFKDFFSRVLCDIKQGKCLCGNYEIETIEMFLKAFTESIQLYESVVTIEEIETERKRVREMLIDTFGIDYK